jgi:hypothetical protein
VLLVRPLAMAGLVVRGSGPLSTYNRIAGVPEWTSTSTENDPGHSTVLAAPPATLVLVTCMLTDPATRRRTVQNDLGSILGLILGFYLAIAALLVMLVHFERTLDRPKDQPRPATQATSPAQIPRKQSTRELRNHRRRRTQIAPTRHRTPRYRIHGHATR